jgi:protoporphyrinogen/coproporphyrinogen III oxidase
MLMTHFECIVIGAGLSGLAAAYCLGQQGHSVLLLEKSGSVGGLMRSERDSNYLFETGPNSVPGSATELLALASEVGLEPARSASLAKKRYLYLQQKLCALPTNPIEALTTPVLSLKGKIRFLAEPMVPVHCMGQEETMAAFITRRFGQEVLQNIVAPFLSGVYAGDPSQLSVDAVFPKLPQWELTDGSVMLGAIGALLSKRKTKQPMGPSSTMSSSPLKRSDLISFQDGLGALPIALQQAMAPCVQIKLNTQALAVQAVEGASQGYQVTCEPASLQRDTPETALPEVFSAKSIILATPAAISARLLDTLQSEVAELLQHIPYVPVVVVHIAVPRQEIPHPLDGFGCLLPRESGLKTLGIIWASSLFSGRAPKNETLFSCYIGGATHPEAVSLSDDVLEALALEDLKTVFQAKTLIPSFLKILRYNSAIPQYTLGHRPRVEKITALLKETLPGVALAGNYLQGISLNACIQSSNAAIEAIQPSL